MRPRRGSKGEEGERGEGGRRGGARAIVCSLKTLYKIGGGVRGC